MIPNSVVFANNKGGAGKTSMAANFAGLAAAGGMRVLIVELDQQGNIGDDLGYSWKPEVVEDGGALLAAIADGTSIIPTYQARERLDVIQGGAMTDILEASLAGMETQYGEQATLFKVHDAIVRVLNASTQPYELVVIDTPPRPNSPLVRAALTMANYLVAPTQIDRASIRGLNGLAKTVGHVVELTNPDIELLGVALFRVSAATEPAVLRDTKKFIKENLGASIPIFDTTIRNLISGQKASREHGELAHETEKGAAAAAKDWSEHLRNGTQPERRYSTAASKFAADYENLSREIMERMITSQQRKATNDDTHEVVPT